MAGGHRSEREHLRREPTTPDLLQHIENVARVDKNRRVLDTATSVLSSSLNPIKSWRAGELDEIRRALSDLRREVLARLGAADNGIVLRSVSEGCGR